MTKFIKNRKLSNVEKLLQQIVEVVLTKKRF